MIFSALVAYEEPKIRKIETFQIQRQCHWKVKGFDEYTCRTIDLIAEMSITLNGEDDGSTVLNPEIFWLEKY